MRSDGGGLTCATTVALFAHLLIVALRGCWAAPVADKVLSAAKAGGRCAISCDGARRRTVCASDGRAYSSACEIQRANLCDGKRLTPVDCPSHTPTRAAAEERCTLSMKQEFVANFLKLLLEEFERLPVDSNTSQELSREESAVQWKLESLDNDGDGKLSGLELRHLKRIVRNNLHPKACSRDLAEVCDYDRDAEISRDEWYVCFGQRTPDDAAAQVAAQADSQLPTDSQTMAQENAEYDEVDIAPPAGRGASAQFLPLATKLLPGDHGTGNHPRRDRDDPHGKRPRANSDHLVSLTERTCIDMRDSALRNLASGAARFVPVCQSNGKFQREQCQAQGLYCWCVDEDLGSPIPGSIVSGAASVRPNCSKAGKDVTNDAEQADDDGDVARSSEVTTLSAPRRRPHRGREGELYGCTNKKAFLSEVVNTFVREMASSNKSGSYPAEGSWTTAEKALHWKVTQCDKNGDDRLNSNEARDLQRALAGPHSRMTASVHGRCVGGLLNYCDINADKHLTFGELAECLELRVSQHVELQQADAEGGKAVLPTDIGLNPFVHMLTPMRRSR